jgi:hypothetical protein
MKKVKMKENPIRRKKMKMQESPIWRRTRKMKLNPQPPAYQSKSL